MKKVTVKIWIRVYDFTRKLSKKQVEADIISLPGSARQWAVHTTDTNTVKISDVKTGYLLVDRDTRKEALAIAKEVMITRKIDAKCVKVESSPSYIPLDSLPEWTDEQAGK